MSGLVHPAFNQMQLRAVLGIEVAWRTLELDRELDEPRLIAQSARTLGRLARRLGQADEAGRLYTEAATLYRQERDDLGLANTLQAQGDLVVRLGRVDEAGRLYAEAAALYRQERDNLGLANTLKAQGDLAGRLGQVDKAGRLYAERDSTGLGYTYAELARVAISSGDKETGDRLLPDAMRHAMASGNLAVAAYIIGVWREISPETVPEETQGIVRRGHQGEIAKSQDY